MRWGSGDENRVDRSTARSARSNRNEQMPRRREIPKRELAADPVYASTLVTKFINTVMNDGKRSTAEHILYKSFDIIKERTGDDPLKVFKKALDNVKPSLEVKSRRVGGADDQGTGRGGREARL